MALQACIADSDAQGTGACTATTWYTAPARAAREMRNQIHLTDITVEMAPMYCAKSWISAGGM